MTEPVTRPTLEGTQKPVRRWSEAQRAKFKATRQAHPTDPEVRKRISDTFKARGIAPPSSTNARGLHAQIAALAAENQKLRERLAEAERLIGVYQNIADGRAAKTEALRAALRQMRSALVWLDRVHNSTSALQYGPRIYQTTDMFTSVQAALASAAPLLEGEGASK